MQDIPYDVSHVPIDYDEFVNVKEIRNKVSRKDERRERREQRAALERDVSQLRKHLITEVNMRNALNRGLSRPLGSLPRIYGTLPVETRDLLLEVAVLEEEIVSLEKQVMLLGREIEVGAVPTTNKETIWPNPNQNTPPESVEILDSPSISPKDSAKVKSKPGLSPRKPTDQKSNLSKPSVPAEMVLDLKSSSTKTVSIPLRKSADIGSFVKSSMPPKDSSKPRRASALVPPQKPQLQRCSSLPKVPRNTGDFKSRRLSLPKYESQGTALIYTHTVPFIPVKKSAPKDEKSAPPSSPAPVCSSDLRRSCSLPPRIKAENGKPQATRNSRLGIKDAPMAQVVKAPSTPRPPEQEKALKHTSRLPRQPVTHHAISTRRTTKPSTAAFEQKMGIKKSSILPNHRRPSYCDSSLQEPVDADAGKGDTNNELDGDYKLTHLSQEVAKISQPKCFPERDSKLGLEDEADSILLSEEVVKLLITIYGNMQEKQSPLASEFDTSPYSSISTSLSGASPDDYEMRRGINIKL